MRSLQFKWVFHGDVQAVGFRATAQFLAQKYGLKGFAKNLSNGDVEVVAQGEIKELNAFEQNLLQRFSCEATIKEEGGVNEKFTTFTVH